jgi:large subunit ribosomal protein L7/L12
LAAEATTGTSSTTTTPPPAASSSKITNIVDQISTLTLLEAAELVDQLKVSLTTRYIARRSGHMAPAACFGNHSVG